VFKQINRSREPISPTWFAKIRDDLANLKKTLERLNARDNIQQGVAEVVQRRNSVKSPYKTVEQRKKEIAATKAERQVYLAKSIHEKQDRAARARSERPKSRSQFWQEQYATRAAEQQAQCYSLQPEN